MIEMNVAKKNMAHVIGLETGLEFLHVGGAERLGSFRQRGEKDGQNRRAASFFRAVNELPTLALLAIVVLVVVKPF